MSVDPVRPASLDDGDLFGRLRAGDRSAAREALAELYRRHGRAVLAFLERVEAPEPEDLMHDTFLAAARRAHMFRGANARGWLVTLARNRVADGRRRDRRRRRRERRAGEERSPVRSEGAPHGAAALLDQALTRLSPGLRLALELRFVQGLRHDEVAAALGVSLRTAKQRSADGIARLRELMEEHP